MQNNTLRLKALSCSNIRCGFIIIKDLWMEDPMRGMDRPQNITKQSSSIELTSCNSAYVSNLSIYPNHPVIFCVYFRQLSEGIKIK